MNLHGSDVKGVERLVLEFVVIDDGAVAGHDFGDRVGEVRPLAEERFDDGDLASAAGHDEVPVMRHQPLIRSAAAEVEDVDEALDDGSRRDLDERTVAPHGGVQRRQRVLLVVGVTREVLDERFALHRFANR